MNISKFWENIHPFSVINLPYGIQGPIYNILSLPKGARSSAAIKHRISKFLTPMGAVYLLRRWRIASVTADQYQTNQHRLTHIYRCQQIMPSLAKVMAYNLSSANLFNHHHNRCIVLWTNISNGNHCYRSQRVRKLDRSYYSEMHTSKKYCFEFERNIAGLLISSLAGYIWNKIE